MGQEIVFGSEDSEVVETQPVDGRQNVVRKNVVQKPKTGKLGSVAHYHHKENDVEEWDEPCLFVEHVIGIPGGIDINDDNYRGKVIVAQCAADQFAYMEAAWNDRERNIFRSKSVNKVVASY